MRSDRRNRDIENEYFVGSLWTLMDKSLFSLIYGHSIRLECVILAVGKTPENEVSRQHTKMVADLRVPRKFPRTCSF